MQNNGETFTLTRSTQIIYPADNDKLHTAAVLLSEYIYQITGYHLEISTAYQTEDCIVLNANFDNANKESYRLIIGNSMISINGSTEAGTFYGIQTLRKSIPAYSADIIDFPAAEITDYPIYSHRGVHLDVARHFYPVDFIKKYIDVIALCNMNVFHWHLTDDQGWRIEIEKYPELTRIGSQRKHTNIGRHTDQNDNTPHGGFYTQQQIREIVNYAKARHIEVIPEIDIPGHTLSALTSYPQLGCTGGPYEVACGWGIFEDVLCAGNEEVFVFLEDVFKEVSDLFPSRYIHIGGDECLKNKWMECPRCQAKVKELGIRETKEHSVGEQLQSYFIARVEKMIRENGKTIIGWDEIIEGGIAPNATIMSWRGMEGGVHAAEKGHDVIMAPEEYVYLDYYQSPDVDNEPFTYGWLTELDKVYSFDPMPAELSEDKKKHILGAQLNVWTEYMPTSDHVEYMLLPRMCALAETVWTNPVEKDFNYFVERLYKLSLLLDRLQYKNSKYIFNVSEDNPSQEKISHKAVNKPITLAYEPHERYTFDGASTLVDGKKGARSSYRTGTWIGFLGTDCEAVIDLEDVTEVSSVHMDTYVNTRGNLFDPVHIKVLVSDDGTNFKEVHTENYGHRTEHCNPYIESKAVKLQEAVKTRFIKIIAGAVKTLPEWHEKKGEKAYLMIDEIIVR